MREGVTAGADTGGAYRLPSGCVGQIRGFGT